MFERGPGTPANINGSDRLPRVHLFAASVFTGEITRDNACTIPHRKKRRQSSAVTPIQMSASVVLALFSPRDGRMVGFPNLRDLSRGGTRHSSHSPLVPQYLYIPL